ncbi:hypothetical protein HWV23_02645 [Natronomonas halophila]|uniref:hypothetical protein n=1 Tax=Natronomonas halophila TaxID=2747817 RepID=UPI0015B48119|nr:hypothetical protein [Natronomonas halophila]QLD84598.1 hypothetical protein HWV23_02360 [Natronomonas halophila]QLD84654.1 hypothetical protein HWV23_02645 [Natronomonas halophila]
MSDDKSEREEDLEEMLEAAEDETSPVALAERAYNRNEDAEPKARLSNSSAPARAKHD